MADLHVSIAQHATRKPQHVRGDLWVSAWFLPGIGMSWLVVAGMLYVQADSTAFSVETALGLYSLQQYELLWQKDPTDTKCLLAWVRGLRPPCILPLAQHVCSNYLMLSCAVAFQDVGARLHAILHGY